MSKIVLYIEDNLINVKLVESIMKPHPAELLVATRADEGIKIAQEKKPDLILMDINLPEMNGYQALEKLQEIETTRDIPVIAVTAKAMSGDDEKGLKAGFRAYITKPLNIPLFLEEINKFLG